MQGPYTVRTVYKNNNMITDWRSTANFKCSHNSDWELTRHILISDVKRKQKGKRVESSYGTVYVQVISKVYVNFFLTDYLLFILHNLSKFSQCIAGCHLSVMCDIRN